MYKIKELKNIMKEHLIIAKNRVFKDKETQLTTKEVELIIEKLYSQFK